MPSEPNQQRGHRPTRVLWLACKLALILAILNVLILQIKATSGLFLFVNGLVVAAGLVSFIRIRLTTPQPAHEHVEKGKGIVAWH